MPVCAISIGSNLGDRRAHVEWAIGELGDALADSIASPIIETEPVGVPDEQPPYLNAVVVGTTDLSARDLLHWLMELERRQGRLRPGIRAARTLDLDLILYGDWIVDEPGLQVPHPRFRERAFVLQPLAAVAGGLVDPVTGKSMVELVGELGREMGQGRK